MQFIDFLSNFFQLNFINNYKILTFRTENNSVLFFSKFLNLLKYDLNLQVQTINPQLTSLNNFKMSSQVSFLSSKSIYWVNLLDLETKNKNEWLSFLNNYSENNFIACAIDLSSDNSLEIINPNALTIDIPEYINLNLYKELFKFIYAKSILDLNFVKNIYEKTPLLNLDDAIKTMHYAVLLGSKSEDFLQNWLENIVNKESSLFTLSQYFFAKQEKKFFNYWFNIKNNYGDEFWIVFLSEQIWQAIIFVSIAHKSGPIEAKKNVNRLPFSFTKKDWQLYNLDFLIKSYNLLYNLDHSLKNGKLDSSSIDLWCIRFFKEFV